MSSTSNTFVVEARRCIEVLAENGLNSGNYIILAIVRLVVCICIARFKPEYSTFVFRVVCTLNRHYFGIQHSLFGACNRSTLISP